MRVLLSGSTGLIGRAVRRALEARGDEVRTVGGGSLVDGTFDRSVLDGIDAAVHLAGEPIGGKARWTAAHKAAVRDSRIRGTSTLTTALAAGDRKPGVLVAGSAVGVYGDRGDEVLDESSAPGTGFLAQLVQDWEEAARPAQDAGIRVAHIRTGLVLDREDGLLPRLTLPARFGLAPRFGDGRQWMSWVSIEDEVRAILHLLDNDIRGPVNATSPNPVTNREMTAAVAHALRRPAFLAVPKVVLRTALGESADEMLLSGQRAQPRALLDSGFTFSQPDLGAALAAILGR